MFPPDRDNPVRVEFFGDEIESIRSFEIDTQLSIKEIDDIRLCPAIGPEEGPNLIEFLSGSRLILNEPDDIKRRYPLFEQERLLPDQEFLSFTSLPMEGEGINLGAAGAGGHGLLREERSSVEDLVGNVLALRESFFILIVSSSEGQSGRLKELFVDKGSDMPVLTGSKAMKSSHSPVTTVGDLSRGFKHRDVIVLTGSDIFGRSPVSRQTKRSRVSKLISSIEDFREGDYLVHIEHGIGKFLGIKRSNIEGHEGDFISIEYLGGDKLSVPLERIDYVQKYNAPENVRPKLDRLGGKTWQKTKQRVKKKIKDMAKQLLKIYASRMSAAGNAFSEDTELHKEFDGFFPYEETPDQLSSIKEIKKDMEKSAPMDRLLCGDVGYGKTEVVMRAAFKAVYDSKQAAVLVPTTILAEQHYETFCTRFSAFPVKIDYLSRFKSAAEKKDTLKRLAQGDIDIIIGTHGLLGKKVEFFDLGLLVIDEEHKFGVSHKERIKELKANVDALSLSATPIPRTLHMALTGVRGMSTIETPPEDRLAVKSSVARFNPQTIGEAIQKELDRNGQAFFVHNRISDIYEIAGFIGGLVPDAKIGVAHGRLNEKELEHVMRAFSHGEKNVLVATSIISSGLDIPSANTIIINRADRFGLADLYQLRGRVGRSDVKAYAYLLIPGEDLITEEARKKLEAIQEMGYLGAGFRLALRDLEIRGAGNMLGAEQSGHIEAIGFDMYMDMLKNTVAELKGEKVPSNIEPAINLGITAMIPEGYIEDPDLRLSVYRKIASAKDIGALRNMSDELRDRFGRLPGKTERLIEIMELKVMAKNLYITKMDNFLGRIKIYFSAETPVKPERMLSLYRDGREYLSFLPEGGIELDLRKKSWNEIVVVLKDILEELGGG
jgi:transcription-repair coupling factor (superfamily II helicase)